MTTLQKNIFKKSSQTFYYSTFFFPQYIQQDIYKLYAFVRIADDYVDILPASKEKFYVFRDQSFYYIDHRDEKSQEPIIVGFLEIYEKYNFKRAWVVSFLSAMESDLGDVCMKTQEDLEGYMYGSAGVVGYMMCAIFGILDEKRLESAKIFAYSLQSINFIRDIDEDNLLGRKYLYNTNDIKYDGLIVSDENIERFLVYHMGHYYEYVKKSLSGLLELPLIFRVAVITASDIYGWTAGEICRNPKRIFEEKIKPSKHRVLFFGVRNIFRELFRTIFKKTFRIKSF